ncbi:M50 family metallopeptidase [Aureibacillus halotolerans]|uniref:Peptidase M50B-like protein n=1 Tax=Aureibacillus halotolerans TaxID=1508390 RepID=A0A4R6U8Z9_9BACI|nr:M50 family metallopeptidase [Aureibacillus halotolerans]TDQ42232.1 peptidase M50B-like protein [Aureibacillus halotolerans]
MNWKVVAASVLIFVLLYVPGVQAILRTWNTIVHESGHALMAVIVGGQVSSIQLFADLTGVTRSWTSTGWPMIVVSLSGYLTSSAVLLLFAWLWRKKAYNVLLGIAGVLVFANGVFWVRNPYGLLWIIGFLVLVGLLFWKGNRSWLAFTSFGLTLTLLVDSVRAAFDIFILSLFRSGSAGDASLLAQTTFVPALVWGLLFLIISIWAAWQSIRLLLPAFKAQKEMAAPRVEKRPRETRG